MTTAQGEREELTTATADTRQYVELIYAPPRPPSTRTILVEIIAKEATNA